MLKAILEKLGMLSGASASPDSREQEVCAQPAAVEAPVHMAPMDGETSMAGPRTVGFTDAVKAGWFNGAAGELCQGFAIGADDIVLDVGCGEGGATMFCALQGAHVVFSDLERDKVEALALRVSETTPARRHEALVGDTNPLPLSDNYASRIIAMEMLEHTERPQNILKELVRVGQPGALYLLTVPDPVAEKLQQGIAPAEYYQAPNHVRIFERDEFEQTVTNAGLEVVARSSMGFYWSIWMMFFWVTEAAAGKQVEGAVHDTIKPPYHPLLETWSSTWQQLMTMPAGLDLKTKLDEFMPKTQVIIARKPR